MFYVFCQAAQAGSNADYYLNALELFWLVEQYSGDTACIGDISCMTIAYGM